MRREWIAVLTLVFATAAQAADINSDFSAFTDWRYVLQHERFVPSSTPFVGDLKTVVDHLHAKYRQVPYQHAAEIYGDEHHWATREETQAHGAADCKGIAVAQLYDLLEMGIPDSDVNIIVASSRRTGELHAVTQVRGWVLNNPIPRVQTKKEFERYYLPIFAINRIGWHRMKPNTQLAGE